MKKLDAEVGAVKKQYLEYKFIEGFEPSIQTSYNYGELFQ